MPIIIDEIEGFPKSCIRTKNGDVWVVSRGIMKPLKWRIMDALGVLTGKYEAFRYLTEKDFEHCNSIKDMKQFRGRTEEEKAALKKSEAANSSK